ncbi:MAG: lytic transglycosylase protein [Herminiimonas sp.]|nr:lytic transglycosylase protein [Herminiimonas sp.]
MPIHEIMAGAAGAACGACEHKPYHHLVMQASNQHGVPAGLIHAVIQKESAYNPVATSRQNARGLMQITPGTGKYMGVGNSRQLYDPQTNIDTGTAYLKYLMRSHDTVEEVLAAYNSGPGNVRKYNGVPPFSETRRYVRDVKTVFAFTSNIE